MKNNRNSPIAIPAEAFKKIGYELIDTIADFIESIDEKPVTTGEGPMQLQEFFGNAGLPNDGIAPGIVVSNASKLLIEHSLFNGHPKFFGYITSSAAPIGALADLLASSINPNVGAQILSPIATEIEKQTIRWLCEFIGVSTSYGGVLVSGGNMANFTAFLAARTAKGPKKIKEEGITKEDKLVIYCSKATHTWIEKAAVLFGLGLNAIHWIPSSETNKMNLEILQETIQADLDAGCKPIMVIGNAGDVSTGAVDDLKQLAAICGRYDLWFHVDGAYGIPAAVVPGIHYLFEGIEEADSIALDPHKWLYSPLEAGCTLVKDRNYLIETFSSHPVYYNFDKGGDIPMHNFYEHGLQNSRGFRALKVWMALQQVGRNGYIKMISDDIALSKLMYQVAIEHPELEAITQNLSIATFRYVPMQMQSDNNSYLNKLNETLLNELQQGGRVFLSNALVQEKYCLRACIVNFRTSEDTIHEIIDVIVEEGRKVHERLKEKPDVTSVA